MGALFSYSSDFEESAAYLSGLGYKHWGITVGGTNGIPYGRAEELLADPSRIRAMKETLKKHDISLSGFNTHANHVHPKKELGDRYTKDLEHTIRLAEAFGLNHITTFSGCPGESPRGEYPNFVVSPYPDDYFEVYEYQWNEVLIPYWTRMARFAIEHGVTEICLEMYPGFSVYNPESLLKLRKSAGEVIGACFDPSHLAYLGIHCPLAIRHLGKAVYEFHCKDCFVDVDNVRLNGIIDPKPHKFRKDRAWIHAALGYGHDELYWKDILRNLLMIGYKGVVHVENDDGLMTHREGFEKGTKFLKDILIQEQSSGNWWDHKDQKES
jgi:sugar phosphate isomerase/epimerase